jgi:hypothetical protein
MGTALDRADSDCVSDEERLQTRLDGEEPAELTEFRHMLSKRHANGVVPPFPD